MRTAAVVTGYVLCLALLSPAWADSDKGKGHGGKHSETVVVVPSRATALIVVTERDRMAARSYFRAEYIGGNCPPGLAKKGTGCVPPGQAARLWVVGQPLPVAVAYFPLPQALLVELTPAPSGYQYVRAGNDILLMVTASRVISAPVADLALLEDPMQPLISDRDRDIVNSYYRTDYLNGNCPDDLVRRDVGCQLPDSADRRWAVGQPLPPAVDYAPLPVALLAQLAPPPDGYKYIRIGDEILVMVVTSRIVTERIVALGNLHAPSEAILYERGNCPPGLAKKHNGCLPPGHAK